MPPIILTCPYVEHCEGATEPPTPAKVSFFFFLFPLMIGSDQIRLQIDQLRLVKDKLLVVIRLLLLFLSGGNFENCYLTWIMHY